MQNIKCDCGTTMTFIDYLQVIGTNGTFDFKGLYKCQNCKNITMVDVSHDELYKERYIPEYKENLRIESIMDEKHIKILRYVTVMLVIALIIITIIQ